MSYFIAPEAASLADIMADDAAMAADEAASIADEAEAIADEAASDAGAEGAAIVAGGGVAVVVVSSFLLQAAKETAAASETMSNAVFILLLDLEFGCGQVGSLLSRSPGVQRQGIQSVPMPNPRL
jgi:hypothetical protein